MIIARTILRTFSAFCFSFKDWMWAILFSHRPVFDHRRQNERSCPIDHVSRRQCEEARRNVSPRRAMSARLSATSSVNEIAPRPPYLSRCASGNRYARLINLYRTGVYLYFPRTLHANHFSDHDIFSRRTHGISHCDFSF